MHKRAPLLVAIGLMAALALAGCAGARRGAAGNEVVIKMMANNFEVRSLEVKAGTVVKWVNADPVDHSVWEGVPDSGNYRFQSPDFGPGGQYSYTFEQPGTYPIFCKTGGHYLTGMKMQVVVKK